MSSIDDILLGRGPRPCAVRPIIGKCGTLASERCSLCDKPVCEKHLVGSECIHCNAL